MKTFLQVPGINSVRFTIENEDLTDSRGQAVGNMTERYQRNKLLLLTPFSVTNKFQIGGYHIE